MINKIIKTKIFNLAKYLDDNLSEEMYCQLGTLEQFEQKYGPKNLVFIAENERGKGGFGTVYEHSSGVAIKMA